MMSKSLGALIWLSTIAACGGSDDEGVVTLIDAADLGSADAAVDAAPITCTAPEELCSGSCVDTSGDELNCGDCGTVCSGGKACVSSACVCPAGFVPAHPELAQATLQSFGGMQLGLGGLFSTTINMLVVGFPDAAAATLAVDQAYPLNGTLNGPFAGAGYDLNDQFIPSAAFFGTAGTVTFTRICRDDTSGAITGFSGQLDGARFSAVEGLFNPMLVDGGCSFDAPLDGGTTVAFDYNCPAD